MRVVNKNQAFPVRNVWLWLIGINIFIALFQSVLFSESLLRQLVLVSDSVLARPWTLITHMFLHANFAHIFFNMYALFLFGPFLERKIGPQRFLLVYFASGIVAAIGFSLLRPGSSALGASGAIMGMVGALILVMPHLRLLFLFFIPMPLWVAGLAWAALDIFGLFYETGIGNIAHLIGLVVGLGFGLLFREKRRQFQKKFVKKKHLSNEDIQEYFRSGRI